MRLLNIFFIAKVLSVSLGQVTAYWSNWSEWSACSRSCGGGITVSYRNCSKSENTNLGCIGGSTKYQLCNIQDCPEGSVDFRMLQCSAYDKIPYKGKYFKWAGFVHPAGECELKCMPKKEFFFVTFAKQVADGTRCNSLGPDVCVNGQCLPVGCDMQLFSTAKLDNCGRCNGDNSSCQLVSSEYKLSSDSYDYVDIIKIPSGSTNIEIEEVGTPANYIALSSNGKTILNSDHIFSRSLTRKHGSGILSYERNKQLNVVRLTGPTDFPIQLKVFAMKPENAVISYKYYVPTTYTGIAHKKPKYAWVTKDWTVCSRTCSGGLKRREIFCSNKENGETVKSFYCNDIRKPITKDVCNTQPCPARWYISQWSPCSVTCGKGVHTRRVHCVQSQSDGNVKMLDFSECTGPIPTKLEECVIQDKCPNWVAGEWNTCSKSCGEGIVTRSVSCMEASNANSVEEDKCSLENKPAIQKTCFNVPCGGRWEVQEWGECSALCGSGIRSRNVLCRSSEGYEVPAEHCNVDEEPSSFMSCTAAGPCKPIWHSTEWSNCTAQCSFGMQLREVFCAVKTNGKNLNVIDESACEEDNKPAKIRRCYNKKPCYVNYFVSNWGKCSSSCGTGIQLRKVKCYADREIDYSDKSCAKLSKPKSFKMCNLQTCGNEVQPTTTPETNIDTTVSRTVARNLAAFVESLDGFGQLHEGDNSDYECIVKGHPTPEVTWTLNGQQISTSRFYSLEITGGSRLVLLAASSVDSGKLTCTARNRFGEYSRSILIEVSGPPVISITPSSIEKKEGDRLIIECEAKGSPTPRIQWTKDSLTFYGDNDRVIVTEDRIIFKRLLVGDAGRYRCLGFNSAGSSNDAVIVTVFRNGAAVKKDCYDDNTRADCLLIASVSQLCSIPHYNQVCCVTCNAKG